MNDRPRPKIELVKMKKDDEGTPSGVVQAGAEQSPTRTQESVRKADTQRVSDATRVQEPTRVIAPGVVIEGRYLIGKVLGAGAFGLVYEARNLELDERVALKTMRPEIAVDTAMVARFAREAKAAASIKSEYVASVYDVGTCADGPYIVMEYLEGKELGQVLEESGPLDARTAVEYALQICEALAVAHAKGIIHRDIKPENLLVTGRAGGMSIVKVLDFGISKAALGGSIFGHELPIVKTLNLMGTPLYMSPEQVRRADNVDVRSDIWSLGMVLYEIIAGAPPFEGTTVTEICAAIIEEPPKPIELFRPDLPAGLVDVIFRCLEKDVNRRYQNIAEVAVALMPFGPKRSRLNVERAVAALQGAGQVGASLLVESVAPSPATSSPVPRVPPVRVPAGLGLEPAERPTPDAASDPRPKMKRLLFGLLTMLFLLCGVGGGLYYLRRTHRDAIFRRPAPIETATPTPVAAEPPVTASAAPAPTPEPVTPEPPASVDVVATAATHPPPPRVVWRPSVPAPARPAPPPQPAPQPAKPAPVAATSTAATPPAPSAAPHPTGRTFRHEL